MVAGDFDPAEIKPLVERLFGTLPPGAPISRKYTPPTESIAVRLARVKRATTIDAVQLPKVLYTYTSPVAYGPGDAEARLIADVLARGKASRLYKRLVIDDALAVEVAASQQSYPLGSLLQIDVLTRPDADLGRVEAAMDEEIARLTRDGPAEEELERARAGVELEALEGLQSIERKADRLNEYEYYYGQPNSFKRDLDRFRAATTATVRDWSGRILAQNARAIIRVLPEKPQRQPSPRDQRPADSPTGPFSLAPPETFTLDGGLRVALFTRKDLPLVALRLVCRPGVPLDAPGKHGMGALTARMLGEGAGDLDALAFENAVQSIGAEFDSSADRESIDVSMSVLKRTLERALPLFADAVRRPRMEPKEWQRVQTLTIEELRSEQDDPPVVAARVGDRLLFGDDNPYAWPSQGTIGSVGSLTLQDVKGAHARLLRPEHCTLLVAGDLTGAEARGALEKVFGDWKAGAPPAPRPALDLRPASAEGARVAIVDRPGAVQTVIRFVAPGVKYAHPDRVRLRLINTLLGGSFTSRLNQNLREDKGYTYGARSRFEMEPSAGVFYAQASVRADATGAALREFFREFERLRAGDATDDEAGKVRQTVRNETIRPLSRLSGLLEAAAPLVKSGLGFDTLAQDLAAVEKIGSSDLNTIGRAALPIERAVLVLVGDKAVLREQLAAVAADLKLPGAEEFDVEGSPARGD